MNVNKKTYEPQPQGSKHQNQICDLSVLLRKNILLPITVTAIIPRPIKTNVPGKLILSAISPINKTGIGVTNAIITSRKEKILPCISALALVCKIVLA